jgi:hypothetical protein
MRAHLENICRLDWRLCRAFVGVDVIVHHKRDNGRRVILRAALGRTLFLRRIAQYKCWYEVSRRT